MTDRKNIVCSHNYPALTICNYYPVLFGDKLRHDGTRVLTNTTINCSDLGRKLAKNCINIGIL